MIHTPYLPTGLKTKAFRLDHWKTRMIFYLHIKKYLDHGKDFLKPVIPYRQYF
jgi:hypothetical protein